MSEVIHQEAVYSAERIQTTAIGSPPEPPVAGESPHSEAPAPSPNQNLRAKLAAWLEAVRTRGLPAPAELAQFLKRTRRTWLIAGGAILGLFAVVTLVERVSEWAKNARQRRMEQAIASLTPDRLIARCGQPAEDVTKEVYPVLMRTMTYESAVGEKRVLAFSRTAEEKSDWVFLSVKDDSATSYDTNEAKIAALPCLNSRK